jgi:hypothetical protein
MLTNFEKAFHKMKADVQIKEGPRDTQVRARGRSRRVINRMTTPASYTVNVRNGKFVFDLGGSNAKLVVQDSDAKDRHVLVNVQTETVNEKGGGTTIKNEKWLCGHDERDWFVAAVGTTAVNIWEAKQDLKPAVVKAKEVAVKPKNRQKRKNDAFLRQGEWFFVPVDQKLVPANPVIHNDEPMSRPGGGKPHIVEECFRLGGRQVMVKGAVVLTQQEFNNLPESQKYGYMSRTADATVFVRGYVKHPDHETIHLKEWHSIMMNEEKRSKNLVFLD